MAFNINSFLLLLLVAYIFIIIISTSRAIQWPWSSVLWLRTLPEILSFKMATSAVLFEAPKENQTSQPHWFFQKSTSSLQTWAGKIYTSTVLIWLKTYATVFTMYSIIKWLFLVINYVFCPVVFSSGLFLSRLHKSLFLMMNINQPAITTRITRK